MQGLFCNASLCSLRLFNLKCLFVMKMCHLIAFAGGMLAGGAIALLFAPKKGEELRMDIKRKMAGLKNDIAAGAACGNGCCEEKVDVTVEE